MKLFAEKSVLVSQIYLTRMCLTSFFFNFIRHRTTEKSFLSFIAFKLTYVLQKFSNDGILYIYRDIDDSNINIIILKSG